VARANGVSLPQGVLNGLTADLNLIATAPHLLPGWLRMPQGHRVVGPVYARLPGELPEFLADLAAGPQPPGEHHEVTGTQQAGVCLP